MGAFNTEATLQASPTIIPKIVAAIEEEFRNDGYDVKVDNMISGGAEISISKGDIFKAVLGMRTALKITLSPLFSGLKFEAGVGIFGQQAIPTVISMFFLWPVLLTQIWGMIKQANLDDKALEITRNVIALQSSSAPQVVESTCNTQNKRFCPHCGKLIELKDALFCDGCGSKL